MSASRVTTPESLVEFLAERIAQIVEPLVPPGSRVALLPFPNHGNVGDSAIWLGQTSFLKHAGCRLVYAAEPETHSAERLRDELGDGVILLSGGGWMGDLWPEAEGFREKVIEAFPDRRIVQLPQSMNFRRRESLERAGRVLNAHPDLTLLLRDRKSLEMAREAFRARSLLCPDMSFVLGPLARPRAPRHDVLWLGRRDRESAGDSFPQGVPRIVVQDWVDGVGRASARRFEDALAFRAPRFLGNRAGRSNSHRSGRTVELLIRTYEAAARYRLGRGRRLLGRGKVVITDRLHGHILSLMMGIPHVLVDDRYGKVRSFHETWTSGSPLVQRADTPLEAVERAMEMAGA